MKDKRVEIVEGITGRKVGATLLVCPQCNGEAFVCYVPDGIGHVHFQCCTCGTSFCDGCEHAMASEAAS